MRPWERRWIGLPSRGSIVIRALLVGLCGSLLTAGSAVAAPLLGVSLRHGSLISVSAGGSSAGGPLISVSVGGSSSPSSGEPLIGVSLLNEPPKASAPAPPSAGTPTSPVSEAPVASTGSTTGTTTGTTTSTTPPSGGSSAPVTGSASTSKAQESLASTARVAGASASPSGSGAGGVAHRAAKSIATDKKTPKRATRSTPAKRQATARSGRVQRTLGANGTAASVVSASTATRPSSNVGATHATRAGHPRAATRTRAAANPLTALGREIPLPIAVPDWSKPVILALILLAILLGVRARLAAVRARRLEAQRVTLLRDVDVMQLALVPEVPAQLGGLALSVAYRPAEGPAAGGDFFDIFSPEEGKVAVILGDVCGHGPEALNHAALTRYTLRAYVQAGLQPRTALALAGRALADPTGEHYATVVLGIYDEASGRLTYASAGHPPPIVFGPRRSHQHLTICSSPPIGWGIPTGRRQSTLWLGAGAEVCFLSDGLIEARRGGEQLGREGVLGLLTALGPRPVARDLLERVRGVADAITDDMAACLIAPEASAGVAQVPVEELEVDAAALDGVYVEHFLEACGLPAAEIDRLIALARAIAADCGTALMRVELGSANTTATASPPGPDASDAIEQRAPRSIAQPLLEAVSAT
jgi:hypothetical protein